MILLSIAVVCYMNIVRIQFLEDYWLMVIALVETKNSVVRKSVKSSQSKHAQGLNLFDEYSNCCLLCTRYRVVLENG